MTISPPRRIVLCRDGTWNSTYARQKDGKLVFPDLRQRYRPQNVLQFLAGQPDLEGDELPQDVRDAIAQLRLRSRTATPVTGSA